MKSAMNYCNSDIKTTKINGEIPETNTDTFLIF